MSAAGWEEGCLLQAAGKGVLGRLGGCPLQAGGRGAFTAG